MTFDNQKTTIRIFLNKMILAIVAAVTVVTILTTQWFRPQLLGITQYQWVLIVAGAYLLLVVLSWIRDMNYFYFNDKGDKIIIRYYAIRPLGRKKKAIQIQKISFAGYEIRKTFFGLKKILILKQHMKKTVAKYPHIGITALTKQELALLEKQLSLYVRS
jgi:hypothetical protein